MAPVTVLVVIEPKQYTIQSEPYGEAYRRLLDLASVRCSTFTLIIQPLLAKTERLDELRPQGRQLIESLALYCVEQAEVTAWPGTELLGGTRSATIYRYTLNGLSVVLLKKAADRLYAWMQPDLPEDPCFYTADGGVWLATIAHEGEAFVRLTSDCKAALDGSIPELRLILDESEV